MTSAVVLPVGEDAAPVYLDVATVFALRWFVLMVLRRLGVFERDVQDLAMVVLEQAYFASRAGAYIPHPDRDPVDGLKAWLFGYAWRIARRHQERGSTRNEIPSGLAPGADIPIHTEPQIAAADALLELRHLSRDDCAMVLERADGDTYISIGERRGFSLHTAKRRVQRARAIVGGSIDKGAQ